MRSCLLFVALILAGCNPSDKDKPIVVGHVHPVDPDDAAFKSLSLAVEDANKDPLLLGRRVQMVHAPGGARPEEWGGQAARLLALNRVHGLIGGDRADAAGRIGDTLPGDRVIALSPSGWSGPSPAPSQFCVGVSPVDRGRALAKWAIGRKPQAVAVVRDPAATAANRAANEFVADCKAAGLRVIDPADGPTTASADVVFFACPADQALKARPIGGKVGLFGGDDGDLPALMAGGTAADGFVAASAAHPEIQNESFPAFVARYRERFGVPPSTVGVLTYDAFRIWVEAVRRAGTLDAGPVREQLLKRAKPFETLTGFLTFADDHTARRPVSVGRVADGMLKDVQVSAPDLSK